MNNLNPNNLFEYNFRQKVINGLMIIGFGVFAIFIISLYFLYFSKMDIFHSALIDSVLGFLKYHIFNYTLLGAFLLAFFGGLFFVPLPMEILYGAFISNNPHTMSVFSFYLFGLTLGYSTNLLMGYKFSNFSRKLISVKKFYQIKATINKYGKFAVFLSNVLPLPSQLVSFILGVFKYNKYKFIVQFLLGQSVKLLAITGFILLFK